MTKQDKFNYGSVVVGFVVLVLVFVLATVFDL